MGPTVDHDGTPSVHNIGNTNQNVYPVKIYGGVIGTIRIDKVGVSYRRDMRSHDSPRT